MKILLYGYGNPGRQDDALGIKFIEHMEQWIKDEGLNSIEVDSNYQLNIEDSLKISDKNLVIFIDATLEPIDTFLFSKVEPSEATIEFTMHAVSPAFVLDLCNKIYHITPETYLLRIKGYEWELTEALTPKAQHNLSLAIDFAKAEIIKTFVSSTKK